MLTDNKAGGGHKFVCPPPSNPIGHSPALPDRRRSPRRSRTPSPRHPCDTRPRPSANLDRTLQPNRSQPGTAAVRPARDSSMPVTTRSAVGQAAAAQRPSLPPSSSGRRSGLAAGSRAWRRSRNSPTRSPLARVTSADSRLSTVIPYLRVSQPKPPPSVRPAMPVVELMPTGRASPCGAVAASIAARVAPGSTRARRCAASTLTLVMSPRSMTRPPSQQALPAMLCPAPRTAMARSCAPA